MLHVKDLLRLMMHNEPVTAADVRRMPVVPETASLDDVLATMQRTNAHMAIVIDEHGGTAGIVNLEDLFEEVVGEIDEGVPVAPSIVADRRRRRPRRRDRPARRTRAAFRHRLSIMRRSRA